jgi:hypothetical protein
MRAGRPLHPPDTHRSAPQAPYISPHHDPITPRASVIRQARARIPPRQVLNRFEPPAKVVNRSL